MLKAQQPIAPAIVERCNRTHKEFERVLPKIK